VEGAGLLSAQVGWGLRLKNRNKEPTNSKSENGKEADQPSERVRMVKKIIHKGKEAAA
jgi:hypothetical protein